MREIKFRAWDKEHKIMFYYGRGEMESLADDLDCGIDNAWECMQYAGIKDKNGKELCVGDIVILMQDGEELNICVVENNAPNGGFNLRNIDCEYIEIDSNTEMAIIGNVYENPSLFRG